MKKIFTLIITLLSLQIFANQYQFHTESTLTNSYLYFAKDLTTVSQCPITLSKMTISLSEEDHGTVAIDFNEPNENCLGVIEFGFGPQLPKLIPSEYYLIINGINHGLVPIYPLKGHETDNG